MTSILDNQIIVILLSAFIMDVFSLKLGKKL